MNRRRCLGFLMTSTSMIVAGQAAHALEPAGKPSVELHVDLAVDSAKEEEMLRIFESDFRPAASRQPGFLDARMLKLDAILRGPAPVGCNYRYVLRFVSEELRQKWVATPTHKAIWPKIEATLTSSNYSRLLYDAY